MSIFLLLLTSYFLAKGLNTAASMVRQSGLVGFALIVCAVVLSADPTPEETRLSEIRKSLNVNMFSSADYPATFGIIAGVSILLVVAVAFIVVGLLSMEPAKDSIIYRMTNTRLKKD